MQLVSVQKPVPPRDAERFAALGLTDFSETLSDFAQTLAMLAELDLIVTIDSAVAHLAGASDRPVWVMMPTPADWRWMHDRTDSPWYPSMRLFRQRRPGSWLQVLAEIAAALPAAIELA